jgi:cellulose synthase/poly-beta-1,6-N-acetylglucosamine synthase-like glycosyltransferase
MEASVSYALIFITSVLALPVIIFSLEIFAGVALSRSLHPPPPISGVRPPIAVVIPAHNESLGLLPTLATIQKQLLPGDRLVVVADNCSDDTAAVARAAGAEVIERKDPSRRGKGYALDCGVRYLGSAPPEIVIFIDADCRLTNDAVDRLASSCATTGRPVQALYLMTSPSHLRINHQVAEFSWRVKNWLRPLGLRALNLPCQLMGTGMAFPWRVVNSVELGSPQIVEDLQLGLDLTLVGTPPFFCPSALVTSEFASSVIGAKTQRQRWEHGHIQTILAAAPRLIAIAVARRDRNLMAIALDLSVPPLSLLALLVFGSFGLCLLYALSSGSFAALYVSSASVLAFGTASVLAWIWCGRDVVPPASLLLIPSYAVRKLGLYCQLLLGNINSEWVRTDRKK